MPDSVLALALVQALVVFGFSPFNESFLIHCVEIHDRQRLFDRLLILGQIYGVITFLIVHLYPRVAEMQ